MIISILKALFFTQIYRKVLLDLTRNRSNELGFFVICTFSSGIRLIAHLPENNEDNFRLYYSNNFIDFITVPIPEFAKYGGLKVSSSYFVENVYKLYRDKFIGIKNVRNVVNNVMKICELFDGQFITKGNL